MTTRKLINFLHMLTDPFYGIVLGKEKKTFRWHLGKYWKMWRCDHEYDLLSRGIRQMEGGFASMESSQYLCKKCKQHLIQISHKINE